MIEIGLRSPLLTSDIATEIVDEKSGIAEPRWQ
jgi:hypothetical protein